MPRAAAAGAERELFTESDDNRTSSAGRRRPARGH